MIELGAQPKGNQVIYPFPKGFLWATGNSALQVEGGPGVTQPPSEWARWELRHQPPDKWSDKSVAHYRLYREDFELFRSLGQNAHRFGVEWARIEPEKGVIDQSAVEHYKDVVKALKDNENAPILTLNHFTNPAWFVDMGGWTSPKAADRFNDYTKLMVNELGEDVPIWCTINEPNIYAPFAYFTNDFPPQHHNVLEVFKAFRNMARAHKKAYTTIHEANPKARVGIANSAIHAEPSNPGNPLERAFAAAAANYHLLFYPLSGGMDAHDFLSLDYYESRSAVQKGLQVALEWTSQERSDMGWGIKAEGLYKSLINLRKFKRPVIITENGIADRADRLRPRFIVDHLKAVHKAISEGVEVLGYVHWASTTNMELHRGYGPDFGIVKVDRQTLERTPRPSAYVYKEIAENNGITSDLASLPPII